MLTFSFLFEKRSFRYENDDNKTKANFQTIVFKKVRLLKVFIKLVVSLMIINDVPLITIVNEEKKRKEPAMKGIGTNH